MNGKFNLVKGGWLILFCIGIVLVIPNYSQALTIPYDITLVDNGISASGPPANGWYTEYTLHTFELGDLDAFCVEKVEANSNALYTLVEVPESLETQAAIASLYYSGNIYSIISNDIYAKAITQIAIWESLWNIGYDGFLEDDVAAVLANYSNIIDSIYLAQSPRTSSGLKSQDYLVSVPDADIMWLLGPAFIMLGMLGRKKSISGLKTSPQTQSLC